MQPLCLCVRVCMGAHVCVCVCERERERERANPFAFIHVSLVTNQYLVHIIRSMLFNVADPIPNV